MFDDALAQHLTILFGTLFPALLLGYRWACGVIVIPPAGRGFAVLNVIQTIPSVALFGLLIAPLAGW